MTRFHNLRGRRQGKHCYALTGWILILRFSRCKPWMARRPFLVIVVTVVRDQNRMSPPYRLLRPAPQLADLLCPAAARMRRRALRLAPTTRRKCRVTHVPGRQTCISSAISVAAYQARIRVRHSFLVKLDISVATTPGATANAALAKRRRKMIYQGVYRTFRCRMNRDITDHHA